MHKGWLLVFISRKLSEAWMYGGWRLCRLWTLDLNLSCLRLQSWIVNDDRNSTYNRLTPLQTSSSTISCLTPVSPTISELSSHSCVSYHLLATNYFHSFLRPQPLLGFLKKYPWSFPRRPNCRIWRVLKFPPNVPPSLYFVGVPRDQFSS